MDSQLQAQPQNSQPLVFSRLASWSHTRTGRLILTAGLFLLMALVFGLSHTQAILYEGNQNTKFLHGLARAGVGLLKEDWMANSADPLPVFSYLVYLTYLIEKKLFYVYYILFFGVYIFSLTGIVLHIFPSRRFKLRGLLLFALMTFLHSKLFAYIWSNTALLRRLKIEPEFLQFGVADQYLLGQEFQNSVFGIFLLLAIYLFLKRQHLWAFLVLGVTCIFHSAYLFAAGLITAAFIAILFFDNLGGRWKFWQAPLRETLQAAKKPVLYGLLTAALILPVLAYSSIYLGSTTPEASAQAGYLISHEAIPFHSLPSVWLNRMAYVQFAIMLLGLIVARRTRLFPVMIALVTGGIIFTIVQVVTANDDLALIAPWRVSVLLVPLSTTMLLDRPVAWLLAGLEKIKLQAVGWILGSLAVALLLYCVYRGIGFQKLQMDNYRFLKVAEAFNYVKQTVRPGDVYLIAPYDSELNDFRLQTGAPVYINWKTHPYKDIEVLEWHRRVLLADSFYQARAGTAPGDACAILQDLAGEGVTHVVLKGKNETLDCDFVVETNRANRFAIYAVQKP